MSNWEEKYLTDFANLNYGDNLPSSLLKPFGFRVFGANGYIGYNDTFNIDKKTVLISCRGEYSGAINIVPEKTFVTNNSILVNLKSDDIDTTFIYYKLQTLNKALIVSGSAQPQVTIIDLKRVTLKLPRPAEQQHIAKILSTADGVIEKTQAAIAKYKAIKQGMLQDLFTRGIDLNTNKLRPRFEDAPELYKESKLGWIPREWEVGSLGNLVSSYSGGTPSRGIESYYKGDIPWVTSSEVNQDEILQTNQHINQDALDNSSVKWVQENTVLVAMYGATAGQISMLRIRATTNQAVLACPSLGEISTHFLYYLLVFNKEHLLNKTQGTGQPNLSKSIVDALDVIVPQPNEQEKIAERLKTIDNKLHIEQTYLQKMQSLKKGLMEDLLSGKKQVKVAEEVLTQSEN